MTIEFWSSGFMTNFTCAILEHNWYDMTSVSWRGCHAPLLGFGFAAVVTGSFVAFWVSVSGLCCTILAAAAASSRHFASLAPFLRAAQRSFRLNGLDIMFSVIEDSENNVLIGCFFPFLCDDFGINMHMDFAALSS